MKQIFIVLIWSSISIMGYSQITNDNVSFIQKEIKEIQIENKSFQQKIELIKNDGKAKIAVVEIDKKGNSTQNEYSFNFRDISKEALKYKIDKDLIKITVSTTAKSNFIEVRKAGEFSKYENEFEFFVRDYEKAKSIIEKLGEIQAHFLSKNPENAPPKAFDDATDWLTNNLSNVKTEKLNLDQTISFDPRNTLIATFTTKLSTSKGTEVVFYKFNLADLNCENLSIKVNGQLFSLEIPTKAKSKFISVNENGKSKSNSADLEILSTDLDKIKLWRDAFKTIAADGVSISEKFIPDVENSKNAIQYLKNAYPLEISENCDCTIGFKDGEKNKKYSFNFFDLDEFSPVFKVSGSDYQVNIKSKGGQNFISEFEGEELDKFTNSMAFLHGDLEKFRYMDKALKTIIKTCQDTYKLNVPSGKVLDRLNWLKVKIPNFKNESTSINQKLEFTNEEPCKLKYKTTVNTSGKGKITEYEIKPYLLDVYSSMVKISGKNAFVTFNTIAKEKVIAITEDGKPGNFTNTFSIQIDDIQRAKEVYEVFRTVINDCK